MCVIYLLNRGSKACLRGGRLLVERDGERVASVPLAETECVIVSEHTQVTTEATFKLLAQHSPLIYVDFRGRVQAVLEDAGGHSLDRLQRQMQACGEPDTQLTLVRELVAAKLASQKEFLRRHSFKQREAAREALRCLDDMLAKLPDLDLEALRGCEGAAARMYFDFFPLILPEGWEWHGRSRRPAKDAVNALLNYGYAFLEREVRLAVLGAGLDRRIGFFHANNGRKDSLIYDLMEPFRSSIMDTFILRQLSYKRFQPEQFVLSDEEGCRIQPEARQRWAEDYESYMETPRKSLQGQTPRAWLRQRIRHFAVDLLAHSA